MFSNSLKNAFEIKFHQLKYPFEKNVKKYKTEGSSFNSNKDRSGRRKTERTQEDINLQEKLIEDQRISARKNYFDIGKSTCSRITKRDLKWHPYKMHRRIERNNYK